MAFKLWLIPLAFLLSFGCISATYCSGRYSSGCDSNYMCCNNQCVYGSSCTGQYCSYDSHCSTGETCCNNECYDSYICYGHSCSFDFDCSGSEVCCNGICQYTCYWTDVAIISACVFGSILFFGLVMVIAICCRRRRRQSVTNQPQIITGTNYYPPLQGQHYYQLPPPQYGAIHAPPYEVAVVDSEVPNAVGRVNPAKKI